MIDDVETLTYFAFLEQPTKRKVSLKGQSSLWDVNEKAATKDVYVIISLLRSPGTSVFVRLSSGCPTLSPELGPSQDFFFC